MNLTAQHILITGGSSGLGKSLTLLLLEKGAIVHVLGRSKEKLQALKQQSASPQLFTYVCDITDPKQVETTIASLEKVDVLINNAGVWIEGPLHENSFQDISRAIETNLLGPLYVTKSILVSMRERDAGVIINISSTSGMRGKANEVVYAASKFGVRGFSEALEAELLETNIKVIGFYPGGMQTSFFKSAGSKRETENWMDPDKVAATLIFALEQDASMVLSQMILNKRLPRPTK